MMLAPRLRGGGCGGFRRCCVSAWSANHHKHHHHHRYRYHHLAILNVAQQRADLSDPTMAEFVAATPHINALAKASPGFVWSYDNDNNNDDDDPSADSLLLFRRDDIAEWRDDPFLMPQLSVWENIDSLKHFAFQSAHVRYYKRRHEWFTAHFPKPYTVLYHCSAVAGEENHDDDHHHLSRVVVPPPPTTLVEAFSRLRHLKEHGPTEHAFTFATATQFVIRSTP
jgi:Domain of unknown function (DUF3291)